MRRKILAATTLPLWLTMTVLSQAAMNTVDRLIHAAYFSDACRSEAAALGIVATADADSLFAAFARQVAAPPGAGRPDVLGDECKAPPVLLINLLRGNGIDAALAFISMLRTNAAGEIEPSGKIDRVIVYVPAVNRYLDPSARQDRNDPPLTARDERAGVQDAPCSRKLCDRQCSLDSFRRNTYLAKCDSTYCARRHPPRGFLIRAGPVVRPSIESLTPFHLGGRHGRPFHLEKSTWHCLSTCPTSTAP